VRAPFVPEDDVPSPDATAADSPMLWPGTELERSDQFTDVRQEVIERRRVLSADEYVAHLATVSAYLELPEADRDEVLRRIRDDLPERVVMHADLTLHLARRR
jgi:hypothetical protein